MNNIFHDIVSLFTLGGIYSTKASAAERMTILIYMRRKEVKKRQNS